ncbi:MAG: RsmD family RNA methyltransferase [Actinomycetota bacterium]|nr:RsmD family RNA methyltransferase [Actinomycetota bacterium]
MATLRITAGELGGRRIESPKAGTATRPTTERVREAAFSILGELSGARVLDLFCGTGALGIEAISRGAAEATLVDTETALARRNIEALGLGERARVVRADAVSFLGRTPEGSFDLVLCDPPYGLADRISSELGPLVGRALAPGGRLMIESSPRNPIELGTGLEPVRERTYGRTLVRVLRKRGEA